MTDWQSSLINPELTIISTGSLCSGSGQGHLLSSTFGTLATGWSQANRALYIPVFLERPFQPQVIAWENGASVAGNIDAGIYDVNGNRQGSIGSTAQAGTSATQSAAITTSPATLPPGTYYWAIACSSTSTLIRIAAPSPQRMRVCGIQQQGAAVPLPATATFATITPSQSPYIAVAGVATL